MNLEWGSSVSKEKRDVWAPVTPEKPVMPRSNQIAGENWQDLLGFYSDVLQDDSCVLSPSWNADSYSGVASLNKVVPQNIQPTAVVGQHDVEGVAFAETCDMLLPPSSGLAGLAGRNHWDRNIPNVAAVDKLRGLDQNARNMGSYMLSVGDVVPPRKVNSLAELLGMRSTLNAPTINPSTVSQHSQVERNWTPLFTDSMIPTLQNNILHANQDIGGHNLQQMPSSILSSAYRPSYNLNLPPSSEAEDSSSVDRNVHLVPATPEQKKQLNSNQISPIPHLSIDEISTNKENNKQNFMLPQQAEIEEREHNGFVSDTLSTASPDISTTKEKENLGKNGEFYLNNTPPQKPPKRKKHRPKVVVEGKPRRTPKPAAEKYKNPTGNSPAKRKYVRKKGIKTPTNQSGDGDEVEVINSESRGKTCKRALNFELENGGKKIKCKEVPDQADNNQGTNASKSLNSDFHNSGPNRESTSTIEAVHQNLCREQRRTENSYNFIPSVEKFPQQEAMPHAATIPPIATKDHTLNIIARSLKVQNANVSHCGIQSKYPQVHHHTGEGLPPQLAILGNTSQQDSDGPRQPRRQSFPLLLEDLVDIREKQEPHRAYSHTEMTQPLMVSQMLSHGVSETGHTEKISTRPWLNVAVSSRNNINYIESKINGFTTGNISVEDVPEKNESQRNKSLQAEAYKLQMNGGLLYSGHEEMKTAMKPTYKTNKVTHHWYMNSTSSGLQFQKQMKDTKSHPLSETQANNSLAIVGNSHLLSASHRDLKVIKGNEIIDAPARVSSKRQYTRRRAPSKMSSTDKVLQQDTRNLQRYGLNLKTASGPQGYKRNIYSVDDITYRMKNLQISDNGKENVEGEHNALIPYTGDGAVVPYEAFDPVKKRRPRPKVDLDPETNRLWNLLMGGNEGNESAETMDKNKQKWWEEERRVFRGRVDSFIARMHLVQGDRRFSKWKGSVVDSVIGVFLTQNVSDHLSSSAFMSLAAKFPIKSTTSTSCQKTGKPSTEYVVLVRHPDGTTCHQQMTRELVYDNSAVKFSKLSEHSAEHVISDTIPVNNHTRRLKEGIVSSQSSSESLSFLASEDIRSSSGSNSEVEDQVTGSNIRENQGLLHLFKEAEGSTMVQNNQIQEIGYSFPDSRPSNNHQQHENLANRQYPGVARSTNSYTYPLTSNVQHYHRPTPTSKNLWQGMLMGTGNRENDVFEFLEKECTSSLNSMLCDTTSQTVTEDLHDKAGHSMESSSKELQTGSSKLISQTAYYKFLTRHHEEKMALPAESERRDDQYPINNKHRGMQETFQEETDPIKSAEALKQNPTDNQKPSDNITLDPTELKTVHASTEQSSKISTTSADNQKPSDNITLDQTELKTVHASTEQSSKISTTSAARKQKAEKEKVKDIDWDSLRQQVLKGGTKGRSRETLDSLDYEALRNADVQEISNCIKERGMNNMLAARMKDFLNRLVKDHGSIDLEWLRDAQPDRVKDYLLSIRGLGLKSVECVRLLTLHHLAFPVDTNVGRIAVRLGWVPLQPLPESLQLHLLEMYPVLESIQKYLWPRLCMLDQETLYELHYQLITFGKVFCTKRQPNCNGCPMRGECRHFASAFASARFALPGPEERRIVCSDIPTSSSKSCGVVTRPMPLPTPEDNLESGPGVTRNCEPIIEEPTTPESSIEVTERDIEDAFYEDPDEIPEIKLNIEEFTTNLQSFIQENKELQEGDMSKAIISLSPQLASIPTPKLKHVSRLRTEHQVYELPDTHPLLEGMDRREPDDPSPYLLALWTPGETADSIQPPEGKCSSSEGGLCNKKTCFPCNSTREAQAQSVRGTILIPCRTAMRGSFPLNGTYFQVNEVFADHETSTNPIDVPRSLIWNLPRRMVFFGTSVSTIFKGMSTEGIQYCFWKGFVCVRGFDQKTRAPRPLKARLHLPASKITKQNE